MAFYSVSIFQASIHSFLSQHSSTFRAVRLQLDVRHQEVKCSPARIIWLSCLGGWRAVGSVLGTINLKDIREGGAPDVDLSEQEMGGIGGAFPKTPRGHASSSPWHSQHLYTFPTPSLVCHRLEEL